MRANLALRLSHHLTLALASLCLIVVLKPLVPELHLYLWPVPFLFLGAAFLREGWSLPNGAANLVGLAAAVISLRWLWRNLKGADSVFRHAAFPAILVPYAAVVLMVLTLLITLRARRPRDFWHLQGLGLVQVAVACTLAGPPVFGLLLFAYLASGLACLAVHHHLGQARAAAATAGLRIEDPGSRIQNPPSSILDPRSSLLPLSQATLGWTAAVTGMTIFLTWLTPKPGAIVWDPFVQLGTHSRAVQAQTGYAVEIDLNQTGTIALNDAIAFTVAVTDARGAPKNDLSGDQRWRGGILDIYESGKWLNPYRSGSIGMGLRRTQLPTELPDLGPDRFYFSFRVSVPNAGGLFLAEPVRLGPGNELPVLWENAGRSRERLFEHFMGTLLPLPARNRADYLYKQVAVPARQPDRVPLPQGLKTHFYLRHLKTNHPPELADWTRQLVDRLVQEGSYGLTRKDLEAEPVPISEGRDEIPAAADKIAKALCSYLAGSGDYQYTLDLHRDDPDVDPALDFLQNVKQGHCERFASGLALMLRSQGIPTRLVKGFRGLEAQGDGKFLVRQRHAHSWVEALVPPVEAKDSSRLEWLILDPTPIFEAPQIQGPSWIALMLEHFRNYDLLWKKLFEDYGQDQQAGLIRSMLSWRMFLFLASLLPAVWLVRRQWRRARAPRPPLPFFARLVALLARRGGPVPQPAQTPREYAATAGVFLQSTPARPLANVPAEVARLLYRARFADHPPTPEEGQTLNARLDRMAALLKARRRTGPPAPS